MEESQEIRQLLEEIRDVEREHFAEYQRVTQQLMELNKANAENYRESLRKAQSSWWAILILIAVCLVVNAVMCMSVAGSMSSMRSVVSRAMERVR